jgi:DNA-binding transcriptional LysR family regulator
VSLISPAAMLFDEVARIGSIRRAAEHLNVSPSALNRRILNLEAEYGVKLFERLPRGVRLTSAGEVLIADIRRWRAEQDRSRVRLQEMQGLRRGHLAVGLMECLAGDFARDMFETVQQKFSRFTLDVFIGGTAHIIEKLQASELDIAICFNVADLPYIRKLVTFQVPAGIVVSPDHPLAARSSVHLSDCMDFPYILPDATLASRKLIDRALEAANFRAIPSLVTNSSSLLKLLVDDDRHIAFLGPVNIMQELKENRLRFLAVSGRQMPYEELSLVTRSTHAPSAAVQAIIQLLKERMEALPYHSKAV